MIILSEHEKFQCADAVVFDFDGTLSTLRCGWETVMEPLMIEVICGGGYSEEVAKEVREYIDSSTGIQTIFQMRHLAEEAKKHGVEAKDPWEYKAMYNERLMKTVDERKNAVLKNPEMRKQYLVDGCESFLKGLKESGTKMYAASGTDECDVQREAELLGLDGYFESINGALKGSDCCSKEAVLKKLISKSGKILVVGDGKVEIALGRAANALTLGVASSEDKSEKINSVKYKRLEAAGAHAIVGDFTEYEEILQWM